MEKSLSLSTLAKMIDHSLLHPTMTDGEILAGCVLAKKYGVATACVKPYAIPLARGVLDGSGVGVCAVIAFPHGNSTTSIKVKEADEAVRSGAVEIDMVVNVGRVLGGDWAYVSGEIGAVNDVVTGGHARDRVGGICRASRARRHHARAQFARPHRRPEPDRTLSL